MTNRELAQRLQNWNLEFDEGRREIVNAAKDLVFNVQALEIILEGIIASEGDKYGGLYGKFARGVLEILHGETK